MPTSKAAVLLSVALCWVSSISGDLAHCVLEGPYSIVQCQGMGPGQPAYFSPPDPNLPFGTVSAVWWQLGFGNALIDDPASGAGDVTGGAWITAGDPGDDLFIGNDSGPLSAAGLDLEDAQPFGGPSGSLCFSSATSWGISAIDGCCDNNRNYYRPGGTGDVSDSQLNPYYEAPPGPYAYARMMDAPMGFLLRESTGSQFAAAFIANRPRGGNPGDITPGVWDLNLIANGDQNPAQGGVPNIIPWQPVPQPRLSWGGDPNDGDLVVSWETVRVVHDGSSRPSQEYQPGYSMGTDPNGIPIMGVGVLDQPQLVRHIVEEKPSIAPGMCDSNAPWVPAGSPAEPPSPCTVVTASIDSCIRLRTVFGRIPALEFTPPASKAERGPKQRESQRGLYGDIGYEVVSGVAMATLDLPVLQGTDFDNDGFVVCAECDDGNADVYPGAPQLCGDGVNNDCRHPSYPSLSGTNEGDDDLDTFTECGGDCDDAQQAVYPGAPQACGDGLNNDCDDPGYPSLTGTNEADDDGDTVTECEGDCDDVEPSIFPGAPEICGDLLNNDCNSPSWPVPLPEEVDADVDGFFVCHNDCEDDNPDVNPGASEACNGIDDDCNSLVDDDPNGVDSDSDGVHNACDNCDFAFNPSQVDVDMDGRGNSCDNCLTIYNPAQEDLDSDMRGDPCDNCPSEANTFQDDTDDDTVGDVCDNCIFQPNRDQGDLDSDFEGDICDLDDGLILILMTSSSLLTYQLEVAYAQFDVYRSDLARFLATGEYTQDPLTVPEAAQFCGGTSGLLLDTFTPAPGETVFYLVAGQGGTLGTDSLSSTRPNDNPCQ